MTDAHADHDCNLDKVSAAITVVCGCCYNRGANAVGIGAEVLGVNYFCLLLLLLFRLQLLLLLVGPGPARAISVTTARMFQPLQNFLPQKRRNSLLRFRVFVMAVLRSSDFERAAATGAFPASRNSRSRARSPSRWPEGWQKLWGWGFGSHDPGIRLRLGFWGRGKGLSARCSYATVGAAQGCSLSAAG